MNLDILNEDNKPEETATPKSLREKIAVNFIEQRQIYLWGPVMDKSSETIVEKLLYLEADNPGTAIQFFINSPGGVITAGMAIFDVMKMISSPVYTITMGMAASMGAILFCAGEKGHRYVFEHAKVMIHQPLISGQIVAPAVDIKIHANEIKKTRAELNRVLAEATGKSIKRIEEDTDRDYYLNAQEALDYGIADKILTDLKQLPRPEKKTAKARTANAKKATTKKRAKKS